MPWRTHSPLASLFAKHVHGRINISQQAVPSMQKLLPQQQLLIM
jgi:hypothetical protein